MARGPRAARRRISAPAMERRRERLRRRGRREICAVLCARRRLAMTASANPHAALPGAESQPPLRSRALLATAAWASLVARSVVTLGAGFIATPYLLRYLGADRLGAFRAAQQWSAYLAFLYVGLGPSIVVMLLRPASRGDLNASAAFIKSAISITMRQTLAVVIPA